MELWLQKVAADESSLSRRKFTAEWPGAIDNGSEVKVSSISIALMYGAYHSRLLHVFPKSTVRCPKTMQLEFSS